MLPTNGFARSFSGITSRDMIKYSSFASFDRQAIKSLFPSIKDIGEYEGLQCHVKSGEIRYDT